MSTREADIDRHIGQLFQMLSTGTSNSQADLDTFANSGLALLAIALRNQDRLADTLEEISLELRMAREQRQ